MPEAIAEKRSAVSDDLATAPLLSYVGWMELAGLERLTEIKCKQSDPSLGFEAGEIYEINVCTCEITEYDTRAKLKKEKDFAGRSVETLVVEDVKLKRTGKRITIGGREWVVGNEKEAREAGYIRSYFLIPRQLTLAELRPAEFERWRKVVWNIVNRYA